MIKSFRHRASWSTVACGSRAGSGRETWRQVPKGMPSLERTNLPGNPGWAEATALLREQVATGHAPDFETRLDLARLLLSSGRRDEAHQAFLKLASEAERAGETARAVAVLRRMAVAWPGSEDVERRLADIARQLPASTTQAPSREAALPLPPLRPSEGRIPEASVGPEPPSALGESLSEIEALLDEPGLAEVPSPDAVPGIPAPAVGRGDLSDETVPDEFLDLAVEILRLTPATSVQTASASPNAILASPLFSGLSEQEVLAILRRLQVADYETGDILVTEGEEGQNVFVVSSGRVNVFVRSPTGRDVLVALLGEGDFFGEVSAISGRRRTATVSAATSCGLLELSKTDVDLIARAHPRVKNALDSAFVQRAGNLAAAVARTIDLTAQGRRPVWPEPLVPPRAPASLPCADPGRTPGGGRAHPRRVGHRARAGGARGQGESPAPEDREGGLPGGTGSLPEPPEADGQLARGGVSARTLRWPIPQAGSGRERLPALAGPDGPREDRADPRGRVSPSR